MSRIYRVMFGTATGGVAVSAPQDFIQLNGASGKLIRVRRTWVNAVNTTVPTAQMLQIRERLLPATVTNGSGGSTPTIQPNDRGYPAASFTALANNTTKATTNGTAIELNADGCHIYNGYSNEYSEWPPIGPSQAYVFELLSTVSGTVNLTGGVEVEELGG